MAWWGSRVPEMSDALLLRSASAASDQFAVKGDGPDVDQALVEIA